MNPNVKIIFGLFGGLAIFIFGMNMMSKSLQKAAGERMKKILSLLTKNPILGVLAGALTTAGLQSSSATTVMAIGFVSAGLMTLPQAISIIFGANIGTTITALLASIGQNKDAKRTAVAHSLFNISGCLLFIWFVPLYAKFIQYISPKGDEIAVISRQIANAHTCFNIVMTLIWIPLIYVMVKLVMKIIPDSRNESSKRQDDILYLDKKYLNQPAAALHVTAKELIRCSSIVEALLKSIVEADKKNKDDGKSDFQVFEKVITDSSLIQKISQKINDFMSQLFSLETLTEAQANQAAGLLYVMSDIERIGQFSGEISKNVLELQSTSHKTHYSKDAIKDL